jgi:hypothetical protein
MTAGFVKNVNGDLGNYNMEVKDFYCKVDINLNQNERDELYQIAQHSNFEPYLIEKDNAPDNNHVTEAELLPNWFKEKAKDFLKVGWPVFLKNKGEVPWHTDDKRKSSMTFQLNASETPTIFRNDVGYAWTLHHNLGVYLQNNQQEHSVPKSSKDRFFLQISFVK